MHGGLIHVWRGRATFPTQGLTTPGAGRRGLCDAATSAISAFGMVSVTVHAVVSSISALISAPASEALRTMRAT